MRHLEMGMLTILSNNSQIEHAKKSIANSRPKNSKKNLA